MARTKKDAAPRALRTTRAARLTAPPPPSSSRTQQNPNQWRTERTGAQPSAQTEALPNVQRNVEDAVCSRTRGSRKAAALSAQTNEEVPASGASHDSTAAGASTEESVTRGQNQPPVSGVRRSPRRRKRGINSQDGLQEYTEDGQTDEVHAQKRSRGRRCDGRSLYRITKVELLGRGNKKPKRIAKKRLSLNRFRQSKISYSTTFSREA